MATHSSVLAWRIPGAVEPSGRLSMGLHRIRHDWSDLAAAAGRPGVLQFMGSQRVGHNWATEHTHTHTHGNLCILESILCPLKTTYSWSLFLFLNWSLNVCLLVVLFYLFTFKVDADLISANIFYCLMSFCSMVLISLLSFALNGYFLM